jgi:hypothetical protein
MLCCVQLRFLGQPFVDGSDLRDFLSLVANDTSLKDLTVVVAWAKRSGLSRVRADIETLRARGGRARLVVGISEGGATKQGLELAMELFDETRVFHDETGRTFHPKIYISSGEESAELLIGSNNMTAGGLFYNYEAALAARLDLSESDDKRLYDDVMSYVQKLNEDGALCLELLPETLEALLADARYRIGDEDRTRVPEEETDDEPEDSDSPVEPTPAPATLSLFGRSAHAKRPGPPRSAITQPPRRTAAPTRASTQAPAPAPAPPANPAMALTPDADVRRRWFKRMPASDAQHPPQPTSNITGNLRLTRAGKDIDQTTYFRDVFFPTAAWAATGSGDTERARISFDVVINGQALGTRELAVTHAPHREAGQSNHTTVLHWGELRPTMSAADYTGYYVVFESLNEGSFRLRVIPNDPGDDRFIA